MVNLDRCSGSCKAFDDPSGKICVLNTTEDVNINVFEMIIVINEPKTLAKHISYECKCKFDDITCNLNQKWKKDKCRCTCKNPIKHCVYKNDYI